jgi:hypothetical protein
MNTKKKWETYEEVATFLLNEFRDEFGLEKVEGKQSVLGLRSGTSFEIDAKGIKEGDEGFLIIECRRYTKSRQNQEKMGALAYRIIDTGAKGGIIISPLGIQEGAAKIAEKEKIINVILDENSTRESYIMSFLNEVMVGLSDTVEVSDEVSVKVIGKSEES